VRNCWLPYLIGKDSHLHASLYVTATLPSIVPASVTTLPHTSAHIPFGRFFKLFRQVWHRSFRFGNHQQSWGVFSICAPVLVARCCSLASYQNDITHELKFQCSFRVLMNNTPGFLLINNKLSSS
jgi:hypothetical protein